MQVGALQVFEGVLAVVAVFRIGFDALPADGGGALVVVVVGAVVGEFAVLFDEVPGKFGGEVGVLLVVAVPLSQRLDGLLVKGVFLDDAVDEAIAFVVIVEEEVLVVTVLVDELLEDAQATDDGVVTVAEVGFGEFHVGQPPKLGVPLGIEVVGIGIVTIVIGHAMEEEVEHGGFKPQIVGVRSFVEGQVVFGIHCLELGDGLKGQ